ncbi:hypothetical protein HK101_006304, partial [Irineochytrium annulatum]
AYTLSTPHPTLLWTVPRPTLTTADLRVLHPTSNEHLLAHVQQPIPSDPQRRAREHLLHAKGADESSLVVLRSAVDGSEWGRVDFAGRGVWVRALQLTRWHLVVAGVRKGGGGGPTTAQGGGGVRPVTVAVFTLRDLRCVWEGCVADLAVHGETGRVGLSASDDGSRVFVWGEPGAGAQGNGRAGSLSAGGRGGRQAEAMARSPGVMSFDVVTGVCNLYRRRTAKRSASSGTGIGSGMRGDPGGMWVVFKDGEVEKCVWMRKP